KVKDAYDYQPAYPERSAQSPPPAAGRTARRRCNRSGEVHARPSLIYFRFEVSMTISRRSFLRAGAAVAAGSRLAVAAKSGLQIGVTDWNLQLAGKVDAVALAHRIGFDGVEVSLGRKLVDGKLPLDNSDLQDQYLSAARKERIALAGTCLDILHVNYL